MTLEVFHDIQENVIHIRPVIELDLHGIQVAESISHIELKVHCTILVLWHRLRDIWVCLLLYCKWRLWFRCCVHRH